MKRINYAEELDRAVSMEKFGMYESALIRYRACYYASAVDSPERKEMMKAMLRCREKGATKYIPGDHSSNHSCHKVLRNSL